MMPSRPDEALFHMVAMMSCDDNMAQITEVDEPHATSYGTCIGIAIDGFEALVILLLKNDHPNSVAMVF